MRLKGKRPGNKNMNAVEGMNGRERSSLDLGDSWSARKMGKSCPDAAPLGCKWEFTLRAVRPLISYI